ncbi:hypothetical protein SDC9_117753 [bioreactor metagenome]|uniref:HTH cro/C1-type domain-containing protein n=1 Tax=bioreactor metagenome TaxID=1076179 RepID=A0A645C638_9ZZZZ
MFSKNLKYYRLKNSLTKKELAKRLNITSMAITHYENGDRKPNMEILEQLASEFQIRVSDFLSIRNENLEFQHGEFRKNTTLTSSQQEYIRESAEEYLARFMNIVEILGGEVLPAAPKLHALDLQHDDEINAQMLRNHLHLASEGPINNLIGLLENKGFLILQSDINSDKFSGMNGMVNEHPYIVINPSMTTERNRSTIVHELAHMMFYWPSHLDEKSIETRATSISGAFLFPKKDVIRELGIRRSVIANDMTLTAKEYGISMLLLVTRAKICSVINEGVAKDFFIKASAHGWRKEEPSRIAEEEPKLFEQLVFRAINESEISIQKGAELLKLPYDEVKTRCCFVEE